MSRSRVVMESLQARRMLSGEGVRGFTYIDGERYEETLPRAEWAAADGVTLRLAEAHRAEFERTGYLAEGPRAGDAPWLLGYAADGSPVFRAVTLAEVAQQFEVVERDGKTYVGPNPNPALLYSPGYTGFDSGGEPVPDEGNAPNSQPGRVFGFRYVDGKRYNETLPRSEWAAADAEALAAAAAWQAEALAEGRLVEGPRAGDEPWVLGYDDDGLCVTRANTYAEIGERYDVLEIDGRTYTGPHAEEPVDYGYTGFNSAGEPVPDEDSVPGSAGSVSPTANAEGGRGPDHAGRVAVEAAQPVAPAARDDDSVSDDVLV